MFRFAVLTSELTAFRKHFYCSHANVSLDVTAFLCRKSRRYIDLTIFGVIHGLFRDLIRLSTNGACSLQCFKNSVFQLCQPLTTSVSDKIFSRHSLPAMSFKNSFRQHFYNLWTLWAYDPHCYSVIWLHQWLWRVSNDHLMPFSTPWFLNVSQELKLKLYPKV